MEFEWDEGKRRANLVKHGIDFLDAATMWGRSVLDPAESKIVASEIRHLALGTIGADDFIIAAIYTVRGNTRRLISARRARRNERSIYQNLFGRGR